MNALSHPVEAPASQRPLTSVAGLCAMVFAEFLAMGLPLPVLPEHVSSALGFGPFVVGLAIGAQSWATLLTRHAAGTRSDHRGPQSTAVLGLALSALAGVLMAASSFPGGASAGLAMLLLGRGLLGLGESLVITSALSWGVGLAGRERTGLVMAWVGIAMYGALAVGAPIGSALFARFGFVGVAVAAAVAPLFGLITALQTRTIATVGTARLPVHTVARLIWLPGLGLTASALGFGAIAAFSTLRFKEAGWPHAPLAMVAFGAAYVLARLVFGRLPDRLGGARVALGSTAIAAVGQTLMWLAPNAGVAIAAAGLTGLGFSLAFPAFGVEAIKHVPPQHRGVAVGAFAACFDLAMGVGVPALGLAVGAFSLSAAFGIGALGATLGLVVALVLLRAPAKAVLS